MGPGFGTGGSPWTFESHAAPEAPSDICLGIAPRREAAQAADEDSFVEEVTVKEKPAQILQPNSLDLEGRRIHGVIGRDILIDELVFSFDRDIGEVVLTSVET